MTSLARFACQITFYLATCIFFQQHNVFYHPVAGVGTVITSGNRTANILSISWSTSITNIVYIVVTATNTMNGVESSTVVGGVERKVSLPVNYSDPYNVIVKVFDQCQQNFTSEVFNTEGLPVNYPTPTVERSNTSCMISSSTMYLACSPPPKQPCTTEVQNEGNHNSGPPFEKFGAKSISTKLHATRYRVSAVSLICRCSAYIIKELLVNFFGRLLTHRIWGRRCHECSFACKIKLGFYVKINTHNAKWSMQTWLTTIIFSLMTG